jgi:hypothetical protein
MVVRCYGVPVRETLLTLKLLIGERRVLSEPALTAYGWDDVLDARDGDEEFEAHWLRVSIEVDNLLRALGPEGELQPTGGRRQAGGFPGRERGYGAV